MQSFASAALVTHHVGNPHECKHCSAASLHYSFASLRWFSFILSPSLHQTNCTSRIVCTYWPQNYPQTKRSENICWAIFLAASMIIEGQIPSHSKKFYYLFQSEISTVLMPLLAFSSKYKMEFKQNVSNHSLAGISIENFKKVSVSLSLILT